MDAVTFSAIGLIDLLADLQRGGLQLCVLRDTIDRRARKRGDRLLGARLLLGGRLLVAGGQNAQRRNGPEGREYSQRARNKVDLHTMYLRQSRRTDHSRRYSQPDPVRRNGTSKVEEAGGSFERGQQTARQDDDQPEYDRRARQHPTLKVGLEICPDMSELAMLGEGEIKRVHPGPDDDGHFQFEHGTGPVLIRVAREEGRAGGQIEHKSGDGDGNQLQDRWDRDRLEIAQNTYINETNGAE